VPDARLLWCDELGARRRGAWAGAARGASTVNKAEDLILLVYTSTATRELSTEELRAMLEGGRRRNAARGVTGLLAYHDGQFMQAIEGPRAVVDALFARIADDWRHYGILVLLHERRSARQFVDHAMAYRDMRDEPLPDGHSGLMNDGLRAESFQGHSDKVHRLLQVFADTQLRRGR
jgi:hypothetical protein